MMSPEDTNSEFRERVTVSSNMVNEVGSKGRESEQG